MSQPSVTVVLSLCHGAEFSWRGRSAACSPRRASSWSCGSTTTARPTGRSRSPRASSPITASGPRPQPPGAAVPGQHEPRARRRRPGRLLRALGLRRRDAARQPGAQDRGAGGDRPPGSPSAAGCSIAADGELRTVVLPVMGGEPKLLPAPSLFPLIATANAIAMPTVVVRTDALREVGGFDVRPELTCDWLLWLQLALRVAAPAAGAAGALPRARRERLGQRQGSAGAFATGWRPPSAGRWRTSGSPPRPGAAAPRADPDRRRCAAGRRPGEAQPPDAGRQPVPGARRPGRGARPLPGEPGAARPVPHRRRRRRARAARVAGAGGGGAVVDGGRRRGHGREPAAAGRGWPGWTAAASPSRPPISMPRSRCWRPSCTAGPMSVSGLCEQPLQALAPW